MIKQNMGSLNAMKTTLVPRRIRRKRGRGATGKTPVFALLKRGGTMYVEIVKNSSKIEPIHAIG